MVPGCLERGEGVQAMKLRPFVINDAVKKRIADIEAYAREHIYIPGETLPPGDLPAQVLKTRFGYRAVFSYTRVHNGLYRDLSFSVGQPGKYPNEFVTYTLAQLFGFTGWDGATIVPPPESWMLAKDIHFEAIRIAQPIHEHEIQGPR
jgi:hypothetical protein